MIIIYRSHEIPFRLIPVVALLSGLFAIVSPLAQEGQKKTQSAESSVAAAKGKLVPLTEKEAAWAAKVRAAYPNICITSDESSKALKSLWNSSTAKQGNRIGW
jgi:hypothetical protein